MKIESKKRIRGQIVMEQGTMPEELKSLVEKVGGKFGNADSKVPQIKWTMRPRRKGFIDSPEVWDFLFTFFTGVGSGMIANNFTKWLEELDGTKPLPVEEVGEKRILHCRGAKIVITVEPEEKEKPADALDE